MSLVLLMNHDTLNPLYPRIHGLTVNSIVVPEREPDTATVQVSLAQNGTPVPAGTPVTILAESAEISDEIDVARARRALERADDSEPEGAAAAIAQGPSTEIDHIGFAGLSFDEIGVPGTLQFGVRPVA